MAQINLNLITITRFIIDDFLCFS